MSYVNERLDLVIETLAKATWEFDVSIPPKASGGAERRNLNWDQPLGEWDVSYGVVDAASLESLAALWFNTRGPWLSWFFKDHADYKIPYAGSGLTNQVIAEGDGATQTFQIVRRYTTPGGLNYDRDVYRIIEGTDSAWLDATPLTRVASGPGAGQYSIDITTGLITTGDVLTGGQFLRFAGEFENYVRFKDRKATWMSHHENLHALPQIMIEGLRPEEAFA